MEAYSGWGGAQKAFSEKAEGEWGEIRNRLKELLSEDEFASQRHTVLTAFYTPAPVIGAIYDALREAGIGQGDTPAAILEPGCGTGNFMRLAPADLALDFHGVELDSISARIAQALCPEAHITAAGLEECRVSPASFDAAIGNVPYSGDIKIDGMPIHDYFIKKSVEAVRPGGIVAVLTSRYTLDKNSTATRRALAEQAELLGAVRLPAETFRRQAGTEALSDILLLRRRPEPIALSEDELPEWVETSPFEDTVNINRYFNEHPGRAVGAMSIVSGPMGPTLGVSFKGGADALGVRVSDLLRDSVDQGGAVEMAAAQEHAGISVTPTEPTKFEFSVAADGTIWYGTEDVVEPFAPGGGKTGPERARAMLALRDGARALLALERDPAADDDEVEEAIAELSAEYDSFFERFGRINSKKNLAVFPSKGFTDHSLALNLLSLEKVNSDGEVTGKADILRKRLVTPEAPTPEHVGNPSDALAVTIDARGEVDIDFLADLMETDVQTALERLGDLVVTDPDDASHVMTADEYLSGDVGGKLEHVRELLEAERGRAERQTQQAWNEHLGFAVDAENLTGGARDALAQLRKTHLWESSLNPTTSRFAVDGHAHIEGLDHGARRIDWTSWPALVPLALEAYDGPRPIGLADCDERRWSVSTGNPLLDQLARGLGNFRSGGAGGALETTPAYAIKYLVCDSGLSDEELGAFLAAGGAEPYNGSDYLEAFQSIAGVEIERPERPMYGGPSARESAIENGMRVARALRAAPDAVEYLFRIQRKQCSDECVMKIDLLEPARRTYYQNSWHAATPASLSELATEEGLERFRDHRRRFMEAAKLAVEPADADRVASLERLESRLEAVQPVKLVPGQIACQLGSSWVPASVIRDFALETFKIGYGDAARERGSHQTAAQARGLEVRYVSTGTFDSYLYSIVERKQRFISQVFTNKSPVRTMDDLDETVLSLAQMKQIAEGDPTVAERMDVENKIGQLKLMLASHLDGLADVQHKIETQYRPLVEALTAQRDMLADDEIPFAEADLVRQQTLGSKDSFLTVGGTHIADKEEAIRALRRAAYDVRPGCEETIGTYRGLSVVCRRQRVLDEDWLPYIGLAVDAARHVHMSDRVFPSGEKGAFTVLTQMDRIIARDAKGPAEIELKLRDAQLALADAQKAAKDPFPKQAELDEAEQRLAVLEQERIEAEAQRQREQAQRAEAEAAAIEEGVEEERAAEREHERAAVADDEARWAGRVAELRRQGLICEDSATHAAATAAPNGIASGCPDDVAEAARCSAAASAREEAGVGEKHKAGM